jgi:uncharacterized surface anchored protein
MKKFWISTAIILAISLSAIATPENETGKNTGKTEQPVAITPVVLTGKVVDLNTGESLVGAEIMVEGQNMKAFTDLDGNFRIENLAPGNYNLVCSLISYKKSLIENLKLDPNHKSGFEIGLESSN